ncbi:hypothetical protein COO60DRAFT_311428 [Scenedesmus sp. NREL 46B-D3]|nr:hypothetical protein COO60DRAFT_311428 [Scenedesmus sp. NREL 46B-D3]
MCVGCVLCMCVVVRAFWHVAEQGLRHASTVVGLVAPAYAMHAHLVHFHACCRTLSRQSSPLLPVFNGQWPGHRSAGFSCHCLSSVNWFWADKCRPGGHPQLLPNTHGLGRLLLESTSWYGLVLLLVLVCCAGVPASVSSMLLYGGLCHFKCYVQHGAVTAAICAYLFFITATGGRGSSHNNRCCTFAARLVRWRTLLWQ